MGFKRRYKNFIEKFLSGEQGQVFFQYFYNWGASIVIIGALAKLEHWPWGLGNILLTVGLLTEFLVFFISAFDKPAKTYSWDRVFPILDTNDEEDRPAFGNGGGGNGIAGGIVGGVSGGIIGSGVAEGATQGGGHSGGGSGGGGTVIINGGGGSAATGSEGGTGVIGGIAGGVVGGVGGGFAGGVTGGISEEDALSLTDSIQKMAAAAEQLAAMSEDMKRFTTATDSLSGVSEDITQSSRGYVDNMENLNRNLQGLSNIYEMQLQGVRSQIDAVERINAGLIRMKDMYEGSVVDSSIFRTETEKMTQQLHALNSVYARMLNAMTVNMYGAGFNPNPNPYSNPPYNPPTPNL
jgi:uncharacterized protein YukE